MVLGPRSIVDKVVSLFSLTLIYNTFKQIFRLGSPQASNERRLSEPSRLSTPIIGARILRVLVVAGVRVCFIIGARILRGLVVGAARICFIIGARILRGLIVAGACICSVTNQIFPVVATAL